MDKKRLVDRLASFRECLVSKKKKKKKSFLKRIRVDGASISILLGVRGKITSLNGNIASNFFAK